MKNNFNSDIYKIIIKKLNNVYVIQVGSFASINKAQTLVNQLAQQGFQARIIEE